MSVQLIIDNQEIPVEFITFSDGASNCKLELPEGLVCENFISITVDPITPVDRYSVELNLISAAIALNLSPPMGDIKVIINLPYLPYGRADRVFERGNSHPLHVFGEDIWMKFGRGTEVHLCDPHSCFIMDQFGHVLNFHVKSQVDCFTEIVPVDKHTVLVAPDKGAEPKIRELEMFLAEYKEKYVPVICATKTRDLATGRVVGTELPQCDLSGKTAIIVDDIIDGGGTFIPLAQELKKAGAESVHLYVTHGIFAKGLAVLRPHIDHLYVYQTVLNYVNQTDINNFNLGKEVK